MSWEEITSWGCGATLNRVVWEDLSEGVTSESGPE